MLQEIFEISILDISLKNPRSDFEIPYKLEWVDQCKYSWYIAIFVTKWLREKMGWEPDTAPVILMIA